MFSKKLFSVMGLLVLVFQLSACDRFLKSSKSESNSDEKISVETAQELACLKEAPQKLKRFLEDKAIGGEIPQSVECVQNSLRTFMRYTTGNDSSLYTGAEIQHFFNRYLLKDSQISDSFQAEMMKAKVIFVGGSSDTFTRAELEKFIQFLGLLGEKVQGLEGRMKLIALHKPSGAASVAEIQKAQASIRDLALFFLEQSKITSSKYELNDFISLLEKIDEFVGKDDGIQEIFKWIPLVRDVKKLFMGESANLSNVTEWKNAFLWTVDGYFAVIQFHYLVKDLKYEDPNDWNVLMKWTDQLLVLMKTSPEMVQNKILEAGKIDTVVDRVYDMKLFESVVNKELAKSTYRKAIAYILNGSPHIDSGNEVAGLTLQNLNVISEEYHVWRLSQQFLVDTFLKGKRLNVILNTKNIRAEFNKYDYKKLINSFDPNPIEREDLVQSWSDLRSFLFTATPIIADEAGKMRMQGSLSDLGTSMAGGNLLNSSRSYIRIVMRGYADKKERALFNNSIPKQSFLDLEKDFREFAQKMGLVDPRNKSPAARTFMESNFLTYNGDGNEFMTPTEAVQLLSQMLSGGRTIVNELFSDLTKVDTILRDRKQESCYTGELDIFDKPVAKEGCFKIVLKKWIPKYFEAMPNTKKYLESLNAQEYEEFFKTIMVPAAIEQHRPDFVEYSEARSLIVIMHYIESLMVVFDKNQDQVLSEQELLDAMPRFKNFIAKMSPLGDWFVSDIFLFMVYKGEKPTFTPLVKFKAERAKGLGTVNRLNIIKVLALLKEQSKAEEIKAQEQKNH